MKKITVETIKNTAEYIREHSGEAEIGIVLGSGLGNEVEMISDRKSIAYKDIPNFPVSTVEGHSGNWLSGTISGKRVCVMQGRFHAYEGYSLDEVTLPIRVMKEIGVKTLILTNAAGGVNTSFEPGCLMLLTDFINFSGKNPLCGTNLDEYGPRFPDMSTAYDRELQAIARDVATKQNVDLKEGVYCWFNGPCYETPAEIRMARIVGGDAVGMSTVPETIVARHMDMKVLGISCITNMAAGVLDQPINHQEVMEMGLKVKKTFRKLLEGIVESV